MSESVLAGATPAQRQRLYRLVAAWSDAAEAEAVTFVERYGDPLGREPGNAQLSGLSDLVESGHDLDEIQKFATHQGSKAERAGHYGSQEYWGALRKALEGLKGDAWELAHGAGLPAPDRDSKPKVLRAALDDLYQRLVREWVQHLVAHSIYLQSKR
jgi:hypothetical protein